MGVGGISCFAREKLSPPNPRVKSVAHSTKRDSQIHVPRVYHPAGLGSSHAEFQNASRRERDVGNGRLGRRGLPPLRQIAR